MVRISLIKDVNRIDINESDFKKHHQNGMSNKELGIHFNVSRTVIERHIKKFKLKKNTPIIVMSEKTKKKISEKRKSFLKNNPDKHPWKRKDKHRSVPCENVKGYLLNAGVSFVEEYSPEIGDRFFSIDIALPDKMIAIEVNGQQHYNPDGTLKKYYQDRHDLLESNGWVVYEVHYSCCFNESEWSDIIGELVHSSQKIEFDYLNYTPRKTGRKNKKCPVCKNTHILNNSKSCIKCNGKKRRIERPTKDQLKTDVWEYPSTKVSEKYGVSDVTIAVWCKQYGIEKPTRGYWMKKKHDRV